MTFHPDSLPDLTGKVYIVTGGTSGIGFHTVGRLVEHGAHVYLCCRNSTKGETAISGTKQLYPQAHLSALEMDHLSLSSVVAAAKLFLSKENALHGLINNAGIMATPFEITKDGHEEQWQTNYLAHWVFTSHLLPLMLQTSNTCPPGSVRIVNLTSSGHHSAPKGGINFADTSLPHASGLTRYGQSKLANVLHAKTLDKLYGPGSPSSRAGSGEIWTAAVHPGFVDSQIGVRASEVPSWILKAFNVYGSLGGRFDSDRGSWTSVFCAASLDMKPEQSGTYFQRIAESGWQSCAAKDLSLAARLEEWTTREMRKDGWIP